MFFKKKTRNTPYFIFNFGCAATEKCVSLSVENGVANGEWYDENERHHLVQDLPVTDAFWDALAAAAEESGILEWKAYKLFNRFASEINLEVFNGEGTFPNGIAFEANNMHGLPDGFENAVKALTAIFGDFSDKA